MTIALITVAVRVEQDVVAARQRARHISGLLRFDQQDQARIATAVSEIARNAYRYAGSGEIEFGVEGERSPQLLAIKVKDRGPGIGNLSEVLEGNYRSATGMGLGIVGARRLMDYCHVRSDRRGTTVVLKKVLPEGAPLVDAGAVARITQALASRVAPTAFDEVQEQNRELIRTLSELRERQDELLALNRELEDTNRGVVALYAELAERADSLRRADETKTRFFSNMSHEFRTPLNSIRALSEALMEQTDGALNAEQQTQVRYIAKAAEDLTEIVNDLLDLAKIEAGKIVVRPAEFSVEELFSALRGMLRPLLVGERVALHFDAPPDLPRLHTDESKVSQILRNFVSNALKYTEAGEVRVSAALGQHDEIEFAVADTGIGIAEEDQEIIFEEFEQVPNRLQTRVKGTGLGLPLSKRLAIVLGGRISLESTLGAGSTFRVAIPRQFGPPRVEQPIPQQQLEFAPSRIPVLIVEDSPEEQLRYDKVLRGTAYTPIQARTLRQAMDVFARTRPAAIVLDVKLGSEESWRWLAELKGGARAGPPVILATAADDPRKGYALGADICLAKPVGRAMLLDALNRVTGAKVLVIDDDPAARYAIRKLCSSGGLHVLEAADAQEGLRAAVLMQPDVIVLDLKLPDRAGEEVLEQLVGDQATSAIPVIVATAEDLSQARRDRLSARARAVFSKNELDRRVLQKILAFLPATSPAP